MLGPEAHVANETGSYRKKGNDSSHEVSDKRSPLRIRPRVGVSSSPSVLVRLLEAAPSRMQAAKSTPVESEMIKLLSVRQHL